MISSNNIPKHDTFVSGSENGGSSECSDSFSPDTLDLEISSAQKPISAIWETKTELYIYTRAHAQTQVQKL